MSNHEIITMPEWRRRCVAACPESRIMKMEFITVNQDCSNVASYDGAAKHLAPGGVLAVCGPAGQDVIGHWYANAGVSDVWHFQDGCYDDFENADSQHLTAKQEVSAAKLRDKRFDFVPKGVAVATVVLLLQWISVVPRANWLGTTLVCVIVAGLFQLVSQRSSE